MVSVRLGTIPRGSADGIVPDATPRQTATAVGDGSDAGGQPGSRTAPGVADFQDLPDAVWESVIAACERFEQAWPAGPGIEHYVRDTVDDARRFLLCKLIEIDCEKRRQRGEQPFLQEYLGRFPAEPQVVGAAWAEADTAGALGGSPPGSLPGLTNIAVNAGSPPLPEVPGYRLLRRIGQGGMGVVYQARQLKPDRLVAIKMIKAGCASHEARQRFDVEVQSAGRLRHPHIVAVHECGDVDGQPYFSMDYIDGQSLEVLRRDGLPCRQAALCVQTVAAAIQCAHDHGILHRDLKPANVLVDAAGKPYVTDFGLAKALTSDDTDLTATGEVLGTPGYMSPEQAEGAHERIDRRSDVYSLGAILYALLAGRAPFAAGSPARTIREVIEVEPIPPRRLNPDVPRDLQTICLKCLEKKPAQRYDTARKLADDLDRFLCGEAILARPPSPLERGVRWSRRHRWQAAVIGLSLMAVVLSVTLGISRTLAAERERRQRTEAERYQRLAESHQARAQYQLAKLALEGHDLQTAKQALGEVPISRVSLETRLLRQRLRAQPTQAAALVDDWWNILAAALSPDGKRLVTSYATGTVLVWDLSSGRVTHRLCSGRWSAEALQRQHHFLARTDSQWLQWGPCYTALAWLPGGARVAGVSLDGAVTVFDTAQGQVTTVCQTGESLYAVAVSSDGARLLAGGRAGKLLVLTVKGERERELSQGQAAITSLVRLPGSEHYLLGRADGGLQLVSGPEFATRTAERLPNASYFALGHSEPQGASFALGHGEPQGASRGFLAIARGQSSPAASAVPLKVSGIERLPRAVWDLAAVATDQGWLIAVAGESPEIRLWDVPRTATAITPRAALCGPKPSEEEGFAYHQVRCSADGRRVFALDSLRRLTRWDVATQQVAWTVDYTRPSPLRSVLQRHFKEQTGSDELPPPFRRIGTFVHEVVPQGRLLTAGDDGAVKLWDVPPDVTGLGATLKAKPGRQPQICFDANSPGLLWALDQTGQLTVLDGDADARRASCSAHAGGGGGLTRLGCDGVVVTVGADARVRRWIFANGKIRSADKDLPHDQALLSVAASPNARWLAAVDVSARLIVWDVTTGRPAYLTALTHDMGEAATEPVPRPLTGRVAFNRDSTRLSAFGASQTACVYTTRPFGRLSEQIWIAGNGGTAMVWSPAVASLVLAADDYPRYVCRDFGQAGGEVPIAMPAAGGSACVAMVSTPDERRVVLLEREGTVRFLDAENLVQLHSQQASSRTVCDLAVDPAGVRLAVAADDGSIDYWSTAEPAEQAAVPAEDVPCNWTSTLLVAPSAAVIRLEARMVQLDPRGCVGLLYVESRPGDFRAEGALQYVQEDASGILTERLEVSSPELSRRASPEAATLQFDAAGSPLAAFRLRTAEASPYDGRLYLGRRLARNQWDFGCLHEHGNLGFYPLLRLDQAGAPAELLHYSFGTYHLISSRPGEQPAQEWTSRLIGQQGDGANLMGCRSSDGKWYLGFRPNRFNGDPAPATFACWDGRELQRHPLDPFAALALTSVELGPDGAPVVLAGRQLMQWRPQGWSVFAALPTPPEKGFVIDRDGTVSFAHWDSPRQRFLLWTGRGEHWSTTAIPLPSDLQEPNWWTLRLDERARPVLVAGRQNAPFGWLRVFRRQD